MVMVGGDRERIFQQILAAKAPYMGDYDIAVFFGNPYDLCELGELVEVAETLGVGEDTVDLVALDSATPELILEALEGQVIFARDQYVLFELRVRALMEYLDLRSVMETSLVRKALDGSD